jgi:hypothetical protein
MAAGWGGTPVRAQAPEAAACTLKDRVYTCDASSFGKTLAQAKTAAIETHSVDKVAQAQLATLLTKKLGKTVVADGSPADLVFILVPLGETGMSMSPGEVNLGTMQVYAGSANGSRGPLVWVETYAGQEDMPWPAVVRSLVLRFQEHFHLK